MSTLFNDYFQIRRLISPEFGLVLIQKMIFFMLMSLYYVKCLVHDSCVCDHILTLGVVTALTAIKLKCSCRTTHDVIFFQKMHLLVFKVLRARWKAHLY